MSIKKILLISLTGLAVIAVSLAAFQLTRPQNQNLPAELQKPINLPATQQTKQQPKTEIQTTTYFTIKELGIKFQINNSLANDLTYFYDSWINKEDQKRVETVYFSTISLSKEDTHCSAKNGSLGLIGKTEGQHEETTDPILKNLDVKQFKDFYVYYIGPQAVCGEEELFLSQQKELREATNSIELAE